MKLISCHLKSFGKFVNFHIEFYNELNVVEGLNESGKSTILKFIEGMFYGFVKPYMKRTVYTEDYEKYRPIDRKEYMGSIIFSSNGRDYVLNRDFDAQSFQILDYLTGENLTQVLLKNKSEQLDAPGEYFFNCSSDIFRNTIIMKQKEFQVPIDEVSSLTDFLIYGMQATADEIVDVNEALNDLINYKNKIGQRRSNTRPYGIILNKIDKLEEEIKDLSYITKDYENLLDKYDDLKFENKKLNESLLKIQDKIIYQKYLDLQEKYKEKVALENELINIDRKLEQYSFLEPIYSSNQKEIKEMDTRIREIKEEYTFLSTSKQNLYRSLKHIQEQIDLEKEKDLKLLEFEDSKKKGKFIKQKFLISLIISLIFLALTPIFLSMSSEILLVINFIIIISFLVLAVIFRSRYKKITTSNNNLQDELSDIFQVSYQQLDKYKDTYNFKESIEELEKHSIEVESEIDLIDNKFDKLLMEEQDLNNTISKRIPSSIRKQLNTSKSLSDLLHDYQLLKIQYDEKNKLLLHYDQYDFEILKYELKSQDVPWESISIAEKDTLEQEIQDNSKELLRLEEQIKATENSVKQYLKLHEELQAAYDEKTNFENLQKSIDIAISEINLARQNIQNDFIPSFNQNITEAMQFITDTNYKAILDKEFNLVKVDKDHVFYHDKHLSSGMKDLLYIFLRICLIEYMGELPRIFLFDDAFVQIDNKRLEKIMLLLNEISKDSQIILFTCHEREKKILSKKNLPYHLINL